MKIGIRLGKKTIDVENFFQHGAIGWYIFDDKGGYQTRFDEALAAELICKLAGVSAENYLETVKVMLP